MISFFRIGVSNVISHYVSITHHALKQNLEYVRVYFNTIEATIATENDWRTSLLLNAWSLQGSISRLFWSIGGNLH